MGFVDFTKLSFALSSLAQPFDQMGSIPEYIFVILSQRKAYAGRFQNETARKNRSDNKMATPKASVHPVRNCLCYHYFLYQTNESCSQSVSRRQMLLTRFHISCLRVIAPNAPNATEAELPLYERSRMVLHVTRRLLLQLLASVLSSRVRFWTAAISLISVDGIIEGKATE